VALFAVLIATGLAVAYAAVVGSQIGAAGTVLERTQALYNAKSGLAHARALLMSDDPATDSLEEDWATLIQQPIELDNGQAQVLILDSSSRLNLNAATRDMLLRLPGATEDIVDAIIDWRDSDSEPLPLGAESDYYLTLDPPYEAKNMPFHSLDELLLVRGVTPQIFYGDEQAGQPAWRDLLTTASEEPPLDAEGNERVVIGGGGQSGQSQGFQTFRSRFSRVFTSEEMQRIRDRWPFPSLSAFLSLPGVERNKLLSVLDQVQVSPNAQGQPLKVNVNTAGADVLALLPGMTEEKAQGIVQARAGEQGPFVKREDLLRVLEWEDLSAIVDFVATKSSYFLILDQGTSGDQRRASRTLMAMVRRESGRASIEDCRELVGPKDMPEDFALALQASAPTVIGASQRGS
jgi:type II secretory pathway component PulK